MNDLANFEEQRLAELKHAVAARAAVVHAPPRPRRVVPLAAAGAAVAIGTVAVVATVGDAAPAYAVTRGPGGIVNVDILRYDDAGGLSRRLREAGVPAGVYYVPAGKVCQQPNVTTVTDIPPGLYSPPTNIPGEPRGQGMRLRFDTTLFEPGQHFLFALKVSENGNQSVTQYLVTGEVTPCRFTPVPPPPEDVPEGWTVSEPSLVIPGGPRWAGAD